MTRGQSRSSSSRAGRQDLPPADPLHFGFEAPAFEQPVGPAGVVPNRGRPSAATWGVGFISRSDQPLHYCESGPAAQMPGGPGRISQRPSPGPGPIWTPSRSTHVTKTFGTARRRRRPVPAVPARHHLRLHRPQRLRQDHHAADDHAHPPPRPRAASASSARRRCGAANDRVGYLPEERGLYKTDEGPRRPALLRRAQGLPRLPAGDRRLARAPGPGRRGPTRRSRRCPRAWRRRCSSSPPSSPSPSWSCSTSRSAASTRSTSRCCARRSSSLQQRRHDGHLLDARHGRRREDVRLHLHDLQGQEGARRHAGRRSRTPTAATRSASASTATARRWTGCPAWRR